MVITVGNASSRQHFSAVLMQQGRVQLDADWNEQGAILDRRWRAETTDLIGRCGVPKETPDGFKITAAGDTFTIGPGASMWTDSWSRTMAWDP